MQVSREACQGFEDERQLALRRRLHPPLLRIVLRLCPPAQCALRLRLRPPQSTQCSTPPPPSYAICTMLRASASVLRHSAPTAPRLLTFTFCLSCLMRRANSLHNLLLTKLHRSIRFVHSFTCLYRVGSRHLLIVVLCTFCKLETS